MSSEDDINAVSDTDAARQAQGLERDKIDVTSADVVLVSRKART